MPALWFGAPYALDAALAPADLPPAGYLASLPDLLFIGALLYAPLLLAAIPVAVLAIRVGVRSWLVWGPGVALAGALLCPALGMVRYGLTPEAPGEGAALIWVTAQTAAIAGLSYGWTFWLLASPLLARGR